MQFTTSALALAAAAGTALAAPTTNTVYTGTFTGVAMRDGVSFNGESITVQDLALTIGGQSTAICNNREPCEYGPPTAFGALSDQQVVMDAEVPGAQFVYVAPSGQLLVSPAHASVPSTGIDTPFVYTPGPSHTNGTLIFEGDGADGTYACETSSGVWHLYANIENSAITSDCPQIVFVAVPYNSTTPPVFQYE